MSKKTRVTAPLLAVSMAACTGPRAEPRPVDTTAPASTPAPVTATAPGDAPASATVATGACTPWRPARASVPSDSLSAKVVEIIVNELGVPREIVTPEARFAEDLCADSLDAVELIMAFEEEFGIEIADADAVRITSVGDAIAYLRQHT